MDDSILKKQYQNIQKVKKPKILEKLENPKLIQQRVRSMIWHWIQYEALYYYFEEKNISKTKQSFYTCGHLDEYQIKVYDRNFLKHGIGMKHITYALLSDNLALIKRYGHLACSQLPEYASHGSLSYAVRCILKNDLEALQTQIGIFHNKHLAYKTKKWIEHDVAFLQSYLDQNIEAMKEAINALLTKKMHNKWNREYTLSRGYISIPALTYTKLAWLKGIELDINHPLVPRALLPVQPLEKYIDEYDFLKELDVTQE